jgi:hypothetical protein
MVEVKRRDDATRFANEMIAILRDHPSLQDPARGNTDAVDGASVTRLLADLGRTDEALRLADRYPLEQRGGYFTGVVGELGRRGDFQQATRVARDRLSVIDGPSADKLLRSLGGQSSGVDPKELFGDFGSHLAQSVQLIGEGHARVGEVERAATVLELERDKEMKAYRWMILAANANHGGQHGAAVRAARRAFDLRVGDKGPSALIEGVLEQAVAARDLGLAEQAMAVITDPKPDEQLLLARGYRECGQPDKARKLVHKAIESIEGSEPQEGGPGAAMADAAFELKCLAEPDAAMRTLVRGAELTEAMGDTFYFAPGSYGAVAVGALRMGRSDVLEQAYKALKRPEDRAVFAAVVASVLERPDRWDEGR